MGVLVAQNDDFWNVFMGFLVDFVASIGRDLEGFLNLAIGEGK